MASVRVRFVVDFNLRILFIGLTQLKVLLRLTGVRLPLHLPQPPIKVQEASNKDGVLDKVVHEEPNVRQLKQLKKRVKVEQNGGKGVVVHNLKGEDEEHKAMREKMHLVPQPLQVKLGVPSTMLRERANVAFEEGDGEPHEKRAMRSQKEGDLIKLERLKMRELKGEIVMPSPQVPQPLRVRLTHESRSQKEGEKEVIWSEITSVNSPNCRYQNHQANHNRFQPLSRGSKHCD